VKGKIVLARYGGSWRGIKPKVAAEHGAIACIIYSDPHEDGYFQGEVYPDGPFRGAGMIQRGSVMDMPRYPGDPSTPGRPSKPGVDRVPMDKNGKCKSGYATVHGCGDVLGTEIIHRMPCKNELVMDEPHDAAHPSVARPRHVMRYKNPHHASKPH